MQRLGSWAQKYIGDAVMAVWVHDRPERVGADILRVLRAVSEINTATAEISKTLGLPVPLRIGAGVNTGPAILGGTDYTALGDTVNTAFRLESATKGIGLGVAVGESVYHELAAGARSSSSAGKWNSRATKARVSPGRSPSRPCRRLPAGRCSYMYSGI